jgi:hypothetical protein
LTIPDQPQEYLLESKGGAIAMITIREISQLMARISTIDLAQYYPGLEQDISIADALRIAKTTINKFINECCVLHRRSQLKLVIPKPKLD